jgi:hypothetical protein
MEVTWSLSPVAEVMSLILEAQHPGLVARRRPSADSHWLVVSYREDFSWLWRLDNELLGWMETGPRAVVLVWDGMPSGISADIVNVADTLTAMDWAVALSLASVHRRLTRQSASPWRLILLDLASDKHVLAQNVRLFTRLYDGGLLPWIKVHRPDSAEEFLKEIQAVAVSGPNEEVVEMLRTLWSSLLIRPSASRHTIANLVGPRVLLDTGGAKGRDGQTGVSAPAADSVTTDALDSLLTALKLMPHRPEGRLGFAWVHSDIWAGEIDKFVLLDDMHDLGWAAFLERALDVSSHSDSSKTEETRVRAFGDPSAQVFGSNGDASLVELIEKSLKTGERLSLCGGSREVLFLDLRLFTRQGIGSEAAFIRRLVDLARDVGKRKQGLPWPGFAEEEIAATSRWVSTPTEEHADYHVALTFFPRLLALADPWLPIVLFSSTGRREIVERLRPYANIILDFEKPRFFGDQFEEVVAETRIRLDRAIRYAVRIARGRRLCLPLWRATLPKVSLPFDPHRSCLIQVYVDEDRSVEEEGFRVGGLAIAFPDETAALQFNREILQQGLVWGPTDLNPKPTGALLQKEGLPWRDYENRIFAPVENMLENLKAFAVGFSLRRPAHIPWARDPLDLTSPGCLDNVYRRLVCEALEVLLLERLPILLGGAQCEHSIFVATRLRTKSIADDDSTWDELPSRFGVQTFTTENGQLAFVSVGVDSVFPLIAEILSGEADAGTKGLKVRTARGARLSYGSDPISSEKLPRPTHFLADLVARFSCQPDALKWQPTLREWLQRGYNEISDERLQMQRTACRHARAGRHVDALASVRSLASIAPWAWPRLSKSAQALTGRQFIGLCDRIGDPISD